MRLREIVYSRSHRLFEPGKSRSRVWHLTHMQYFFDVQFVFVLALGLFSVALHTSLPSSSEQQRLLF